MSTPMKNVRNPLLILVLASLVSTPLLFLHPTQVLADSLSEAVKEDISSKSEKEKEQEKKKKDKEKQDEDRHNAEYHDDHDGESHANPSVSASIFVNLLKGRFGGGFTNLNSSIAGLGPLTGGSLYYEWPLAESSWILAYYVEGRFLSGTTSVGTPVSVSPLSAGLRLFYPLSTEVRLIGGLGYGYTSGMVGTTPTYDEGLACDLGLLYQLGGPFSLRAEYNYQGMNTGSLSGISGSLNFSLSW